MRLLIIRHGDPEYVIDGLTGHGKKQAAVLADRLASGLDGNITHLYTSPMGRARKTAAPTEAKLGKVAAVEEWTRELSYWPRLPGTSRPGEGGLAMWDLSAGHVRAHAGVSRATEWDAVPEIADARDPYAELRAFSDAFLARHGYARRPDDDDTGNAGAYAIQRANRDVIAVFCHGGFGLTWIAHLLGLPLSMVWTSFYLAPSSVSTILFDERSPDFAYPRALNIGDTGHLTKAGLALPDSKYERRNVYGAWKRPSGIKANFW